MTQEQWIVKTLQEKWSGTQAVYLFGSVASGEERPESDIDIAVLSSGGRALPENLCEVLQSGLDRDLDLVDLRTVPTVLQKEVVEKGRLLWDADHFETEMFELFVWS